MMQTEILLQIKKNDTKKEECGWQIQARGGVGWSITVFLKFDYELSSLYVNKII